jgi:hypothetical protein
MSDSQSPVICVTCKRPLPPSILHDDSPRYFAQLPLMPQSDSAHDFTGEARQINGYIKAVSYVLHYAEEAEIPDEIYREIFALIEQLSEEADRRLNLADEAMREIWQRDHGKDAPTQAERGA